MKKDRKPASIRQRAMDLLARREHSVVELHQKLKLRNFDNDEIEITLDQLQQDNLLNDSRFAESYINHRINAGIGPAKIHHELRQKGVKDLVVEEYMAPMDSVWNELMEQQRVKKFGEPIPHDYAQKMKQARFLQNKGFSADAVMRLFRQ